MLNEPYSGMLLAVVAANSQVVDTTLHYNLQTDGAGLTKTPFPEHRDHESTTIYVRETCVTRCAPGANACERRTPY